MKTHQLKTDPAVFAAVITGAKTHEIRFNDRNFEVGDMLELRETVHSGAEMKANPGLALVYTGRTALRDISHIQTGYGLTDGWCILSFAQYVARRDQQAAAPGAIPDHWKSKAEWITRGRDLGAEERGRLAVMLLRTLLAAAPSASVTPEAPADPVVEANRQLLLDRSRVGLVKYGKPLECTSLSHAELTQHALEEALDLANYLQAILRKQRHTQLDGDQGEGAAS